MRKDLVDAIHEEHRLHKDAQPLDDMKLLHQACFGPGHMIVDEDEAYQRLIEEKQRTKGIQAPQRISKDYTRVPLSYMQTEDLALWNHLFITTAHTAHPDVTGFETCIQEWKLERYYDPSMIQEGTHHSVRYKEAYDPHYRVMKSIYVTYFDVIRSIYSLVKADKPVLVAIDGRCASGKSTLADILEELFVCNLFHLDDYFLPPEKRSTNRLQEAGGNVDYERFYEEILVPYKQQQSILYRPYDCKTQTIQPVIQKPYRPLTIIEGSYAMHPYFHDPYDFRIFMTCSPDIQKERLQKRSAPLLDRFLNTWIPMEETYFRTFQIEEQADLIVSTDSI